MCKPFNVVPFTDPKSGNVGVITTQETKENGVLLLQTALQDHRIRRAKRVFSVGTAAWGLTQAVDPQARFDNCVNDLIVQASRFKKIVKEGNDVFCKTKIEYSGKDGVSQDDLIMAYIIGVYFITKFANKNA